MLVLIFITPFLLQHLGTEQFGIWLLCQNIATYFNLFNLGFLSNLVAQYASDTTNSKEEHLKLFSTVFFSLLLFGLISVPVFGYIHHYFDVLFKISAEQIILAKKVFTMVYLAFITIFIASTFDMILYYILGKIITKNTLEIIRILVLNLGYVSIILLKGDLYSIAVFYFIVQLIMLWCFYYFSHRYGNLKISWHWFDRNILMSFFKPSFHFLILNMANLIIFAGDNILISAVIGVNHVVLFAMSFKLADIAIKLINKLTDVKSPLMISYIKNHEFAKLKKEFDKLTIWTLCLSFLAMFCIAILGKTALHFWLGNQYHFDQRVLITFATFVMVNALYYHCWIFLNLTGQHTRLSYVVMLEIGLNLLLSFLLSKSFGLFGIALGTLISSLLTSGWFAYYECCAYFKSKTL